MGNTGSSGGNRRRRDTPPPPQPEVATTQYAATPNPSSTGYYHPPPPRYYRPAAEMSMPLPAPYDHHHQQQRANLGGGGGGGGRYPCGPPMMMCMPTPYVEHQNAVTIRNDVNLKKETLRFEADEENPGKFLVAFTFDATVAGSITVIFFAKEGEECKLTPTKESLLPSTTVQFEQGLGQKFRQPSGTGIDFSIFEESNLMKDGGVDVYPLAVKADACPVNQTGPNSQITQAVFDKDKGEYKAKVVKQVLWVNGMRFELQEIYGISNSVEGDFDGNDPGKECVICLSETIDTTVLPCRHMCLCSGCAKVLRFQTNRCPICRQPVERLLEIKVTNGEDHEGNA